MNKLKISSDFEKTASVGCPTANFFIKSWSPSRSERCFFVFWVYGSGDMESYRSRGVSGNITLQRLDYIEYTNGHTSTTHIPNMLKFSFLKFSRCFLLGPRGGALLARFSGGATTQLGKSTTGQPDNWANRLLGKSTTGQISKNQQNRATTGQTSKDQQLKQK